MTAKEINTFHVRICKVKELNEIGQQKIFERNSDSAIQHLTVAVIHLKDIVTDLAAIRDRDIEDSKAQSK